MIENSAVFLDFSDFRHLVDTLIFEKLLSNRTPTFGTVVNVNFIELRKNRCPADCNK